MCAVLGATPAFSADWFDNAGAFMGRIEPWSDGTIWLLIPGTSPSAITLQGRTSTCSVSQIHLLPPAGQEKAWLAVLLSAAATGKGVTVFGECISSNTRIDATRLVVEY
jgi:hypothetical protein